MFSNPRYSTRGISETVPILTQIILWDCIDSMDNNENARPVCSCCGATIETDDYYTFEGSILCDDCYHRETVVCEHCGDRIWADNNAGTDSMPLCNSCYDDYYTTCECCG